MKKNLFSLIVFLISTFSVWSQTKKRHGDVIVITTPRGQASPLSQLTPNATGKKFVIQDSILSNCIIEFYIEKHIKPDSINISSIDEINATLPFHFEIIPDRKPNESLSLMFFLQRGAISRLFTARQGYRFKWKEFKSPENNKKATPLLLIYEEKINDDVVEKTIDKISKSASLDSDKRKFILKVLYSVTDNFYLVNYVKK